MSLQSTEQLTVAQTETTDGPSGRLSPSLVLKLRKPKSGRRVGWSTDVVDNEHLNKKKSKCCCIYTKPRQFGESSSEDEDEKDCEHCSGHVEKKAQRTETVTEPSESETDKTT